MLLQAPILVLPQGQFTPLEEVTIPGLINAAIIITLIVAAVLFVFSLLAGGIKMILSGGKGDKVDEAKRQLVNALVGVFIVFSAWAAMNFLSTFYGVNLLTFEIPTL
jgi:lipoprotein signal peptidase